MFISLFIVSDDSCCWWTVFSYIFRFIFYYKLIFNFSSLGEFYMEKIWLCPLEQFYICFCLIPQVSNEPWANFHYDYYVNKETKNKLTPKTYTRTGFGFQPVGEMIFIKGLYSMSHLSLPGGSILVLTGHLYPISFSLRGLNAHPQCFCVNLTAYCVGFPFSFYFCFSCISLSFWSDQFCL